MSDRDEDLPGIEVSDVLAQDVPGEEDDDALPTDDELDDVAATDNDEDDDDETDLVGATPV